MVEITAISAQKNKDKLNLFVDGEFYGGVLKETAIANNFFVGKKLEKSVLDNILLQSESKLAFCKASDYLASRLHTASELKQKLYKKGFSAKSIGMAIEKLQEYGYINDKEFAQNFVQNSPNASATILRQKLILRGVDKQIIDECLAQIDSESECKSATICAQKYLRGKDLQTVKPKLYVFLARRGYDHSTINKAIKNTLDEEVDD